MNRNEELATMLRQCQIEKDLLFRDYITLKEALLEIEDEANLNEGCCPIAEMALDKVGRR